MKIVRSFRRIFGSRQPFVPVFAQQATYIQQASEALLAMTETMGVSKWRLLEKETIDMQIRDMAQYINAQADALKKMMGLLGDMKKNYA